MIYEIQWTNETLPYKNISLILFSTEAHCLLVWEIDGETYTQRGDFFSSHTFFREPGSANAFTPLQAVSSERSETPPIGCASLARSRFSAPSKSDRVVLIAWSPSGYTPVWTRLPWRPVIPLFINHNMTACQSTRSH